LRSRARTTVPVLAVLFAAQVALASQTIAWRAPADAVAPAPEPGVVDVLGLGDRQFFFRQGLLTLTHADVAGGDPVALRDIDYPALLSWFNLLDRLDPRSSAVPALAAYWYAYTPNRTDSRLVVDYLVARGLSDRETGWRWLVEAVYLARYRLDDLDLALALAHLAARADQPNAPFYVRHLPAFVELQLGHREAALVLLEALLEAEPDLPVDQTGLLRLMIDRIEHTDAAGANGT
jgi:hypothetical protein